MTLRAVLFDLDGTLVDSSIGILNSLAAAFEKTGCKPIKPFSPEIIGPPLLEILSLLSGSSDPLLLGRISESFMGHYDTVGVNQTIPFPGVAQMLQSLNAAEISLHIATNKRHSPTSRIIEAMGWSAMFELVLSPDSVSPALSSKAAILAKLLAEANLQATDCLYIGDRLDDYNAALEVGIPFALAEWGFEGDGSDFPLDAIRLQKPDADHLLTSFFDGA